MELSKDKTEAMKQIVKMFIENRDEVLKAGADFGLYRGWVVCFADDYLPMRKNGEQIGAMVGGNVFVANSAHYAEEVARNLNAKVKQEKARAKLLVLTMPKWSSERARVLQGMIDGLVKQAEQQGITL